MGEAGGGGAKGKLGLGGRQEGGGKEWLWGLTGCVAARGGGHADRLAGAGRDQWLWCCCFLQAGFQLATGKTNPKHS